MPHRGSPVSPPERRALESQGSLQPVAAPLMHLVDAFPEAYPRRGADFHCFTRSWASGLQLEGCVAGQSWIKSTVQRRNRATTPQWSVEQLL